MVVMITDFSYCIFVAVEVDYLPLFDLRINYCRNEKGRRLINPRASGGLKAREGDSTREAITKNRLWHT